MLKIRKLNTILATLQSSTLESDELGREITNEIAHRLIKECYMFTGELSTAEHLTPTEEAKLKAILDTAADILNAIEFRGETVERLPVLARNMADLALSI